MTLLLIIVGVNVVAWCWLAGTAAAQTDPTERDAADPRRHRLPTS